MTEQQATGCAFAIMLAAVAFALGLVVGMLL